MARVWDMLAAVDSPIEDELLRAILERAPNAWAADLDTIAQVTSSVLPGGSTSKVWVAEFGPGVLGGGVSLFLHPRIGVWTPDFVLAVSTVDGGTRVLVATECDGHEFHNRTKEQAQRDRRKDRELSRHGYTVLRFTGSEIHADPVRCADELFSVTSDLVWGKRGGVLEHLSRPIGRVLEQLKAKVEG